MKRIFVLLAALPSALAFAGPADWVPDRRRDQFQNESGYTAVPFIFDLPGVGSGYGVLGGVQNIGGSYADIAGSFFEGDVSGQALGVNSLHIIPRMLIADFGAAHLSKSSFQFYNERGMDSDKDDYTIAESGESIFAGGRLTATFFERRAEVYAGYYGGKMEFKALRDPDGEIIAESEGASADWGQTDIFGLRFDLTDDYVDPRRGLRFEPSFWWSPPEGDSANYYIVDLSLTAYIPIGARSTWAFNFLKSDAHVIGEGESNPRSIAADEGLDYDDITDERERQFIDNLAAQNANGSATSLGGVTRLRSYPENRYIGAHTQFAGTELRWNITDEVKPFDIYLVRDLRTAIQVAFFYEIGTVADHESDLWNTARSSYGVGFRLVTGSGLIYRLDLAHGDEGFQPSIFFQYPWEM